MHAEESAIANRTENTYRDIQRLIETEMQIGDCDVSALNRHRTEHGC